MKFKSLIRILVIMFSFSAQAEVENQSFSINLDLNKIQFVKSNLHIYEASSYYPGIRSEAGHSLFLNEFSSYNIIRINFFDWAVLLSDKCTPDTDYGNCIEKFKEGLYASKGYLNSLLSRGRTKNLVVNIFRVPSWLSIKPDLSSACGGGNSGQSYRPKDYKVWQKMLLVTSNFVKELAKENQTGQILYQFWNEPDLTCNWKEGTDEFLELYAQTMPYLKSIHSESKVGGASLGEWNGKITKDKFTRLKNLNFELMDYAVYNKLPLDFVDFHYFSHQYKDYFIDGITEYRKYQQKLGISETQMPIYLSEWQTQSGIPQRYNPMQAVDAANLFVAMHEVKLWGQGGVPWQDYGAGFDERWGMVTFPEAEKKPIFYVYKFFDEISRISLGINYRSDDIMVNVGDKPTKIGMRQYIISRTSDKCYKMSSWNRIATASEAVLHYFSQQSLNSEDIKSTYGNEPSQMYPNILEAIIKNQPRDKKNIQFFESAHTLYNIVEQINKNAEFSYEINLLGKGNLNKAMALSTGREEMLTGLKKLDVTGNTLNFSLRPTEVIFIEICHD